MAIHSGQKLRASDQPTFEWVAYVPVWTGATTNPVLNNGTIAGRYMRQGDLVVCQGKLSIGSTTTFGSGTYSISLPVQAANLLGGNSIIGSAWIRDSTGADFNALALEGATTFTLRPGASATYAGNVTWTPTTPVTLANTDWVSWLLTYEAA
jgi:hypothetical protein